MEKKAVYDELKVIQGGERPRILLVGNGICRCFAGATQIEDIIIDEWNKKYSTKLAPSRFKREEDYIWKLPFPMQVVVATQDNVQSCMSALSEKLTEIEVCDEQKILIKRLLDLNFDAVLSTNYSLEFEKTTIDKPTKHRIYDHYGRTCEEKPQQKQFGIFQYTRIPYGNEPSLWHIHGTALRKKSMIMGQFYYGKLLSEVISRADKVKKYNPAGNKDKASEGSEPLKTFRPLSWVDYFLLGDVYIVGFEMDYSESDLWWLLSLKKGAFNDTHIYFYNPVNNISAEKKLMLGCFQEIIEIPDVEFVSHGKEEETVNRDYREYYFRVCEDIFEKSEKNKLV